MGETEERERSGTDSVPPSGKFAGEDFLYHLYRGSELLQDDCVPQAKEELERALKLQPRDIEGQGLLGVVYFRLGLYPRAIEIFEDIIQSRPSEITPRVNLSLCYLKTGQHALARDALLEVVERVPDHARGWGYLGLVYERLGDYQKAQGAFERAGQQALALRMQRLAEGAPPDAQTRSITPSGVPLSATNGASLPAPPSVPVLARPASHESPPAGAEPALLGELAFPTAPARLRMLGPRLASIVTDVGFCASADAIAAVMPERAPLSVASLPRRLRGRVSQEPFGAPGTTWHAYAGKARAVLLAGGERSLWALELTGDFVYVREGCLLAFESTLRYENGRLSALGREPVSLVQLAGHGFAILETQGPVSSLAVTSEGQALVRIDDVVGWRGRLLGQGVDSDASPGKLPGAVSFSGDGALFLDLHR